MAGEVDTNAEIAGGKSPTARPENSPVSPALFMDAAQAFQKTAAIKAAVELDVFTKIGAGSGDLASLGAATGAARRGLRILCDFLTICGFLEKAGEEYRLTPSSAAFLDRRSRAYLGGTLDFLASKRSIGQFLDDPAAFVRNGGADATADNVSPENPVWVAFAEAIAPIMAPVAASVAGNVGSLPRAPRKVLDIAAGHGLYGIAIAKAAPDAEIVAVDWAPVLTVAVRNAAEAGIGERFRTIAGSAFEVEWGDGYDLVLVPNFLHHFDEAANVGLLRKIRAGLSDVGQCWVVEFVPNDDRISPAPMPATFALTMLATTPKGDAYTAKELDVMARQAGFARSTAIALPPSPQSLVTLER